MPKKTREKRKRKERRNINLNKNKNKEFEGHQFNVGGHGVLSAIVVQGRSITREYLISTQYYLKECIVN